MATTQFQLPSPKLRNQKSIIQITSVNQNATKIHQLFNLPEFSLNKKYQATIKQIVQSIIEFDKFTDNLENKVDYLLAAQQNQFVQSYQKHMKKIQSQFKVLQEQANKQQELIKYYENQGKMSNLIKKVAMLQQESKRLYSVIDKKQKQIKTLKLQNKVQKDQNKRLYAQIKQMLKTKNQNQTRIQMLSLNERSNDSAMKKMNLKINHNHDQQESTHKFFTTQVQPEQKSIKNELSTTTIQNKKVMGGFTYNLSQNSLLCPQEDVQKSTLKKKITTLSLKNRKLAKISSKVLQSRSQLQNLFINAVAQIKKQIMVKRKIKQCSYQDFKKEDKINLLLTIISNEQILKFVYEKIFYVRDQKDLLQKQNSNILSTGMDRQKSHFTSYQSKRQTMKRGMSVLPYLC